MNPLINPLHLSESLYKLYGNNLALVDVQSDREWSYFDLYENTQKWVLFFSSRQLNPGSVVYWIAKNSIDFFAVLFATKELGLILLPLNWRESLNNQLKVVDLAVPSFILFEQSFLSTVNEIQKLQSAQSQEIISLSHLQFDEINTNVKRHHECETPWYLLLTSGTTGEPKAVIYNWTMHKSNVDNLLSIIEINEADQTLTALPCYHTSGINLFALPALMCGASVRVHQDINYEHLLSDLIQSEVNVALFVPTIYQKLAELDAFNSLRNCAEKFKVMASGGALLTRQLWDTWSDLGIVIQNGCGMTESGPTLFLQTKTQASEEPVAVGSYASGTEVMLVGPDGSAVDEGELGEIWIRGSAITPGYWRNARANSQALRNGWFRTGDVARFNGKQYEIVNRVSDMFICGGENVYPSEIEEVIAKIDGVDEVVVLGESHRIWGEVGVAFVVCHPGKFLTQKDILEFCKDRLARYKIPKRIEFVDELPKTATGKIRRGIVQHWVKH